jgi:hypothetical protein
MRPTHPAAATRGVRVVLLACAPLLVACEQGRAPSEPPGARLSPAARAYVEAAVDTMQRYSIRKREIDWPTFRAAALARAGTAETPAQTHGSLVLTVEALGDAHSQFFAPGNSPFSSLLASRDDTHAFGLRGQAGTGLPDFPVGRMLDARIAYVYVPSFGGTLAVNVRARADSTVDIVRTLDTNGGAAAPCGWLVDLRGNGGGNMYPMIAGLGPLIGDGIAGVFVDADDGRVYWYHRAGEAGTRIGTTDVAAVRVTAPHALRRAAPAIAVLHGAGTASSGEATAISFIGLPNARSFGTPTYGLTTGNRPFRLSDGAVLNLAAAIEGDRTGRLYGGKLVPDEPTAAFTTDPRSGGVDGAMQAAMTWIGRQPSCAVA